MDSFLFVLYNKLSLIVHNYRRYTMSGKILIVGQSGGPTAVINSSLYGVVSEARRHPEEISHVYGMVNGIEGFLNDTILDFDEALPGDKLDALLYTPGAYLGSCRYKLPESLDDPVYPKLFEKFKEMNIGYFQYIGGNDSMDTVSKLSRYAASTGSDIRIIGQPKTIDNDLVQTDHTPGYGSAANLHALQTCLLNQRCSIPTHRPFKGRTGGGKLQRLGGFSPCHQLLHSFPNLGFSVGRQRKGPRYNDMGGARDCASPVGKFLLCSIQAAQVARCIQIFRTHRHLLHLTAVGAGIHIQAAANRAGDAVGKFQPGQAQTGGEVCRSGHRYACQNPNMGIVYLGHSVQTAPGANDQSPPPGVCSQHIGAGA